MGIILKQSFKNTVTTYLGFGIGAVNTLFLYTNLFNLDYVESYLAYMKRSRDSYRMETSAARGASSFHYWYPFTAGWTEACVEESVLPKDTTP